MNKQQLKESRRYWIIVAIVFMTLVFFILFFAPSFYHKIGYNRGVNDTLNNYTCYEKAGFNNDYANNTGMYFAGNWLKPDYSDISYIQISPEKKFIYLKCINSTLKINNNQLYCEE